MSQMSHSSQVHLRSALKVLKYFPNFHYQLVSIKGINPKNFSPIPFLLHFYRHFKFYKLDFNSIKQYIFKVQMESYLKTAKKKNVYHHLKIFIASPTLNILENIESCAISGHKFSISN